MGHWSLVGFCKCRLHDNVGFLLIGYEINYVN